MAKYDKLYYPISEVAKHFGEEISAIRYWEQQFSILKPKKNARGVRLFTPKDMENLETIHYLLRVKKLTVKGAKQELAQGGNSIQQKMEILQKLNNIHDLLAKIKEKI